MPKPDWSRKLSEPIGIGRKKLRTLHDLRSHLLSLSEDRQQYRTWNYVAGRLVDAAEGGDITGAEVSFRMANMMDPKK
jgi:hypothetical protein